MWSAARCLRVAAFATPQAPLARLMGSPVRRHSCRSHSCIESASPFLKAKAASFTYWTHISVTTGSFRNVCVLALSATCPSPLSHVWQLRYSQLHLARRGDRGPPKLGAPEPQRCLNVRPVPVGKAIGGGQVPGKAAHPVWPAGNYADGCRPLAVEGLRRG